MADGPAGILQHVNNCSLWQFGAHLGPQDFSNWMKTMPGRNTVLLFMSLLPVISHSQGYARSNCPMFSGESFHVNNFGKDDVNCGTAAKPCHSISYAVNLAVRQNISSVLINISTGSYKEAESIKLDCSRWQLRRIAFWGARYDR